MFVNLNTTEWQPQLQPNTSIWLNNQNGLCFVTIMTFTTWSENFWILTDNETMVLVLRQKKSIPPPPPPDDPMLSLHARKK